LYQQRADAAVIREHFVRAAEYWLEYVAGREKPKAHASRSPYEYEKAMAVAVCFAPRNIRKAYADIEEWQYRHPRHVQNDAFVAYLEIAKTFVAGRSLDKSRLKRLKESCAADTASKEDRQFVLPKAQGLLAAEGTDQSRWNRAIANLVVAHKEEALHGEYRLLPEGFIAFPALM